MEKTTELDDRKEHILLPLTKVISPVYVVLLPANVMLMTGMTGLPACLHARRATGLMPIVSATHDEWRKTKQQKNNMKGPI